MNGGLNTYGYVYGNPLSWIDPYGLYVDVIVNNNGLLGTHVGIVDTIEPTPGSPGSTVLYDPGGSYHQDIKGSGDALYGNDVNLQDYINYQKQDGSNVEVYHFDTTPKEDAAIQKRIDEQGGCSPGLCSSCSGSVLRGIGPFKNMGSTLTPAGMSRELKAIQDKMKKKKVNGGK